MAKMNKVLKDMSKITKKTKGRISTLGDSLQYIGKQYKWHLLATLIFAAVTVVVILFEPHSGRSLSQNDRFQLLVKVVANQDYSEYGITFGTMPLTRLITAIAPTFVFGVVLTAASKFMKELTGAEFEQVQQWNMAKKKINEAYNHIIVVGLGRVGLNLIHLLYDAGYSVIGLDIAAAQRIKIPLENKSIGWVTYAKFATRGVEHLKEQVPAILIKEGNLQALEQAHISRAIAVCLMTDNFDANLFQLMSIRDRYPHLSIITRVRTEAQARTLYAGGIDRLVEPKNYGAYDIYSLLEVATQTLVKVSGTIPESDYLKLLRTLDQNNFRIIKVWRWQALNQNVTIKLLVHAPVETFDKSIFPKGVQIESA